MVQTYFSVTLEWQYSIDLLFSMGEVRNHWAFIPKQCIWSAFQNEINQLFELNFFSFLNENPNLLCDHQSLECLIQLTISYHSATCFQSAKNTFLPPASCLQKTLLKQTIAVTYSHESVTHYSPVIMKGFCSTYILSSLGCGAVKPFENKKGP